MNSLIRTTLTSIVSLHFGGKIFHWFFAAIEGRRSWEGLCVGLDSAGGFWDGWGTCEVMWTCERRGWGVVMSLFITSTPSNPLKEPITNMTHSYPPAPIVHSTCCTTANCLSSHIPMTRPAAVSTPGFGFCLCSLSIVLMKDGHVHMINHC